MQQASNTENMIPNLSISYHFQYSKMKVYTAQANLHFHEFDPFFRKSENLEIIIAISPHQDGPSPAPKHNGVQMSMTQCRHPG